MFFIQEENVAPYSFKKDGRIILMCVNFCDDDYEQITIETGREYSDIKIITTSNVQEHTPKITYCNGKYTIFETLKGEESYVLIFSE
jgi:Ribonuclease G/E